jgi:hypothetical protein
MVTPAQKVAFRYAADVLLNRIEMAMKDLDVPRFSKRLDLLSDLLDRLGQQTKISNPGISQEAHALSRELFSTLSHLNSEGKEALDGIRNLLEEVV